MTPGLEHKGSLSFPPVTMGSSVHPALCLVSLFLGLWSAGKSSCSCGLCLLPDPVKLHFTAPPFFSLGVKSTVLPQISCTLEGVDIKGGTFRLLKGGQVLAYECPSGFYAYPVQARTCSITGSWSDLKTQDQKIVKKAECRGWQAARVGMGGWQPWTRVRVMVCWARGQVG